MQRPRKSKAGRTIRKRLKKLRRNRGGPSLLFTHFVFCTKFRRKVITDRVWKCLRDAIVDICWELDVDIEALAAEGDHVHLLVQRPPKLSESRLMHRVKGATSRLIRSRRFPEVTSRIFGKAFWSPSYFSSSCGGAPLGTVIGYVSEGQAPRPAHAPTWKPPVRTRTKPSASSFQTEGRPAPSCRTASAATTSNPHRGAHFPRTDESAGLHA